MKIVTLSDHFHLDLWRPIQSLLFNLEAGKPYLFSEIQLKRVMESPAGALVHRISQADVMLKPFVPESGKRQRVLLYNGCGGLGDQIMTWPISKVLHDRGAEVHVLSDPQHEQSWQGLPWVKTITVLPLYWAHLEKYDAHLLFEIISNSYVHEGILQPIDTMLRLCGIDPDTVSDEEKSVRPILTQLENQLADLSFPGKKLGFYQLSASQRNRSLSPEKSVEIVTTLARAFPDIHWIALSGSQISNAYVALLPEDLPNLEVREFPRIRLLWAMVSKASICVGPDSMLMHAGGTFQIPTVGIWGTYSPETRVKYYRHHYPIFHREVCPHSPCNWNMKNLPDFCPPPKNREPGSAFCEVVMSTTTEEVVETVRKALAAA